MATSIKDPSLKTPTPASSEVATGNSLLEKFFVDALKDIYWAEQELVKSLPKMQEAATTETLFTAIADHLAQTQEHVRRLERIFAILNTPAEAKKCFAMEGLLKEADSIVEETESASMTRDAAIIMAAQKIEHYEIATYGSLVEYAKTLGLHEVNGLLSATLDDEKMADTGLTLIAQHGINWQSEFEEDEDATAN